jgi:hypothetical protein
VGIEKSMTYVRSKKATQTHLGGLFLSNLSMPNYSKGVFRMRCIILIANIIGNFALSKISLAQNEIRIGLIISETDHFSTKIGFSENWLKPGFMIQINE